MFTFARIRIGFFAVLLITVAVIATATQSQFPSPLISSSASADLTFAPGGSVASNSTFYLARPDLRKCASPLCGGYFLRRVNQNLTRCANGRSMSECYVTNIDWDGATEIEINRALLRGSILSKGNRNGRYGVFKVAEVWRAASDTKPAGDFFRVRDLGIRCIAAPCLTHSEAKLNSGFERKIAGADINSVGADSQLVGEAQTAMTSANGIIVVGSHSRVTGPAGRSEILNATQFYLRRDKAVSLKPCIKTGCSGQVCSDKEVITTCEYRPEYDCYKKAVCERQANGNCGFTKTRELMNCLARH